MSRLLSSVVSLRMIARHPAVSADAIAQFRDWRVRELVTHAYARVPYYRRLFDAAGLHPRHVRCVADLRHVPVTSKAELRGLATSDLVASGVDPATLVTHTTGGSSGEPFVVRRAWIEERLHGLLGWRSLRAVGVSARDRIVAVVCEHNAALKGEAATQRVMKGTGRFQGSIVNAMMPMEEILARLGEAQADVVGGYAGVLARIADAVGRGEAQTVRPRLLITGGETLAPGMAEQIESGFGVRVYDTYASHEFSRIAVQCPMTRAYHVCDESVALEVLRDGEPVAVGERGEVVGTALHSFAMPFIRYRLEDVVTRGPDTCACGARRSTLGEIQGRMVDMFTLRDGRLVHPYELAGAIKETSLRWTKQYQIVQEREDRVVFRVVANTEPTDAELDGMQAAAAGVLGAGVQFVVDRVQDLGVGDRGKFRVYRSLVRSAYDQQSA